MSLFMAHSGGSLRCRDTAAIEGSPDGLQAATAVHSASLRLPRNDHAFELIEPERDQETDDRDDEQSDIHLLDGKRAPRAPDEITEPAFRSYHLGDCDQHQPDTDAELEPGHDHRQRARQRNGPERVPAVRLVIATHVEINLVDLEHTR